MILKNISEAKTELSALIEAVQKGEEVLIGKAGKPVARLIAYRGAAKARVPGILAGKITIHDDFDGPLPREIGEAFGITYEAKGSSRKRKK
jgi:prevent-host-death family protein